ncbi:MAG: hypothetical protein WBM68_03145, partial [Woeseia sp.]
LYSFRMFFMVFHGKERMDAKTRSHLHETPRVVTVPLILLAIPSAIIGWLTIKPMLFGDFFGKAIFVTEEHDVLAELGEAFHGSAGFILHGMQGPAVYLAAAGALVAWFLFLKRPDFADAIRKRFSGVHNLLERKYFFDELWINGFAAGGRSLGSFLWQKGDALLIDGMMVNGTANSVRRLAGVLRHLQTGYLYHYAFAMIIALTLMLGWLLWLP